MKNPILIAEIGCNHLGKIDVAKDMIKVLANYCKVDIIKFQKRDINSWKDIPLYKQPHLNSFNSYGKTYLEHRKYLEFNIDQHKYLKKVIEKEGLIYSSSVWDIKSTKNIMKLKPKLIKIPSAVNMNLKIYEELKKYKGDIHISFGMTSKEEKKTILKYLEKFNLIKNVIIYHCISGYPLKFEEVCLKEITSLKILRQYFKFKDIGFSGHHLGIALDIAAYCLGANYIERHFTLDRTWKGTDHAASLEPDGMKKLSRDLKNTQEAYQFKPSELLKCEEIQKKKLRFNV